MLTSVILLVGGLILLLFAADWLVRGAATLAAAVGISPLVVGLTVVAFGTSAPELAVSVMSAFAGETAIAVGNVIGSNIFNILVVLGISAVITPLAVKTQLIRLDLPVMIFLSVLVLVLSLDRMLSRLDGLILFGIAVAYVGFLVWQSRKESSDNVLTEYEQEFGKKKQDPEWLKNLALIAVGMGGLVLGSNWLVDGAVAIARHFGVSELIIGLTIISLGTSLPEVATSAVAAMKGERDIAVGNVVGSNIFNIVTVLGISSIVAPSGIHVPQEAINFDFLVMIAVALAALPVFFHGHGIGRGDGAFFLLFYCAYLAYLILGAVGSTFFPLYREVMLFYVAPVVALGLAVILYRAFRQEGNDPFP